jgi:hypothetical protein
MKRFVGGLLALAGGAAALWGGARVVTGSSESRLNVSPEVSLNALTVGLAGLAVLTIGLVWARD